MARLKAVTLGLARPATGQPVLRNIYGSCRSAHAAPIYHHSDISMPVDAPTALKSALKQEVSKPSLSLLPLSNLLRSYIITALSSYPTFLLPSLKILSLLANSSSPLLNPDRNRLLHFVLKRTFYAQFCAGETVDEVQQTAQQLKKMGYMGVILAYGKEIVITKAEKLKIAQRQKLTGVAKDNAAAQSIQDIKAWREGTLETISMTTPGDFVALKFSGAGQGVMMQLANQEEPSEAIAEAITAVCDLAKERGIRLLFDAEQDAVQAGIDAWTMDYQRRYNASKAIVYGTYQAYLRSVPNILARHLAVAKAEGFVLGVKLVRGAYMGSDARSLFWDTKEQTDLAYDGITESLIKRQWNDTLAAPSSPSSDKTSTTYPNVALVLASHNQSSVHKAMAMRWEQAKQGISRIDMSYGQLMGMADEVSCDLVQTCNKIRKMNAAKAGTVDEKHLAADTGPQAYKYLVWGSVGECLKYLVRRAEENRDAVLRARSSRIALRKEVFRRMWPS